ncbi:choice-of-anchor J domain-containing protein [Agromyces sp. MMS24-JH15]|uniref:choice-of-anchor J domain-containing protein n=1 Tax=Agromyces sp. MMS24-JH15 TaxID=3243765 RepID=UPI00374A927F
MTSTLTRTVAVPAGSSALTFKTRYDIEEGYDYATVEVDAGTGFTPIEGSITNVFTDAGAPIGTDGTQAEWADASFDLSAFAGQTVSLRIRYTTDGGVAGNGTDLVPGLFLDDIAIAGVFEDGAEAGANGWTVDGFSAVGTSTTQDFDNYYIAANRSYVSYDQYLKTGPYFFGYNPAKPDFVDHFSYQEGLLISYWDLSYADNDTFAHPGSGRNLYIDAHPKPLKDVNGNYWRSRVQVYDAPFGFKPTDKVDLHVGGVKSTIKAQLPNPLFDDTKQYWYPEVPNHGVKLPAAGVKILVVKQQGTSITVAVF